MNLMQIGSMLFMPAAGALTAFLMRVALHRRAERLEAERVRAMRPVPVRVR